MNKKKWYTGAVVVFSGGVLTLSAFLVPGIVNSEVIAGNGSAVQTNVQPVAAGNAIPVLKVEAPAPVSTVSEDLIKDMSDAEIRRIYDSLNKPGLEPTISGRDMTEAEMKRRLVLEDEYVYDGLRPEQPLPLKRGQAELYLDIETNTLTFPERKLTDEELLQLTDWSYRQIYMYARLHVKAPSLAQDVSQTEAKLLAAESVRKLFDADVSKLMTTVTLREMQMDMQPSWLVSYTPYRSLTLQAQGKEYWQYIVIIDARTGDVLDTTAVNLASKRTPIDTAAAARIEEDASWIHKATQIVMNKQGDKRAIVKADLTDTEVNNKRGIVAVKLLLEDGSHYTAELRYPDQTLRCLIYEP
ncbi:hypothetical protein [Paenibacillus camerounensis]|uniref:hypothetical protein n=1 Tax=Paenibacillus camerounensis TaxID=1243663 RepID=UPI000693990A|nr:hypothetical protein [Paenibacillus camerounensis]